MPPKNDERMKNKLRSSCVGIAGLGGLGSNIAMALARAGVGRLVLVDFDEVEKSNLNRQAYTVDQVGLRKTDALMQNIGRANPDVNVTAICHRLEPGNMMAAFSGVDVLIEALDEAAVKAALIEEASARFPKLPVIAASGVAGIRGAERVRVIRSGNLSIVQDDLAMSCHEAAVLAPKVGLFAHMQACLALEKLLEGIDVD
jgi:sulfur carrier protein ThiS adenylyltransferase